MNKIASLKTACCLLSLRNVEVVGEAQVQFHAVELPHNCFSSLFLFCFGFQLGHVYFDPRRECKDDCYVSLPTHIPGWDSVEGQLTLDFISLSVHSTVLY